jgi:hypothetical protein
MWSILGKLMEWHKVSGEGKEMGLQVPGAVDERKRGTVRDDNIGSSQSSCLVQIVNTYGRLGHSTGRYGYGLETSIRYKVVIYIYT